jgi:hypothetical protein
MVTKHQIDKLSQRIDEVAERLGMAEPVRYRVFLSFIGEDEAEFFRRYPDAPLDRREMITIRFQDPQFFDRSDSAHVPSVE